MAKIGKKVSPLGLTPETFNETRLAHADTHTHEHTHTHEQKPRERKDRRVQLLTYGSLVDRMDAYAKKIDRSRAEVFEAAIQEYLDRVDT